MIKKLKPNRKKPVICIIGPGVVGQAQGKVFVEHGFKTSFLGGNGEKTSKLIQDGYVAHSRTDLFDGSYDFDISMLTVPTPTINGKVDLGPLESASIDLGKRLSSNSKKYHLIVVKSTVPPGTTENLVIPTVAKYSKLTVGPDFGVCMNPEYLREETSLEDARKPWLILIGEYDKKSGDLLSSVYHKFTCEIVRCSLKEAEMQKYVHNLFNAAKITFFNEIRRIGKQIGIDTEKLFQITALSCEGMWNPKYGIKDLGPFQGSCLPKDTSAFLAWAQENGFEAQFVETIIKVNDALLKTNGEKKPTQIGVYL